MKIFRGIAILLPQLIILLNVGARFDLLLGFNRTDAGFSTLLLLLALAPSITLVWFIIEIIISIRLAKHHHKAFSFSAGIGLFLFLRIPWHRYLYAVSFQNVA